MKTLSILFFSIVFISFQASASCENDSNLIKDQISAYHSIKLANGQTISIDSLIVNTVKSETNTYGTGCQVDFYYFQYNESGTLYWCEGNWGETIATLPTSTAKCQP